ncbi:hypothetical protein IJ579_07090 [bacterium]|nr:hypothetical protein [bacterium]
MEINNELLKYTILRKNTIDSVSSEQKKTVDLDGDKIFATGSTTIDGDMISIGGKNVSITNLSGVMSDEEYRAGIRRIAANSANQISTTTYADLSAESIKNIRQVIYNLHNGIEAPVNPVDTSSYTFISGSTFTGVDDLINWLESKGVWDNKKDGLTITNLVKLAQEDDLEDTNRDFFGALNRAFQNHVDKNGNLFTLQDTYRFTSNDGSSYDVLGLDKDGDVTTISREELETFFNDVKNLADYENKVLDYSAIMQYEFNNLADEEKINLAISQVEGQVFSKFGLLTDEQIANFNAEFETALRANFSNAGAETDKLNFVAETAKGYIEDIGTAQLDVINQNVLEPMKTSEFATEFAHVGDVEKAEFTATKVAEYLNTYRVSEDAIHIYYDQICSELTQKYATLSSDSEKINYSKQYIRTFVNRIIGVYGIGELIDNYNEIANTSFENIDNSAKMKYLTDNFNDAFLNIGLTQTQVNSLGSNYANQLQSSLYSYVDKDIDKLDYFISVTEEFIAEQAEAQNAKLDTILEAYKAYLQPEFADISNQAKLDFAIVKTREYLEAMGMQQQIDALDRLLAMDDDFNKVHVGNIALADLNEGVDVYYEGITLGAYQYYAYSYDITRQNSEGKYNKYNYDIKSWASDYDDEDYDLGITLDVRLVEGSEGYDLGNWYDIVNTLVHELTHATAYQYYDAYEDGEITAKGIEYLEKLGAIEVGKYNIEDVQRWYDEIEYDMSWNRTYVPPQLLELEYYAYTAWGEYTAYQADADYIDSIAGDVYSPGVTTAAAGKDEKDTIDSHIRSQYNDANYFEAIPDWKWWSYA